MKEQRMNIIHLRLMILFVSLGAVLVLYLFRHLDDNRLTSWHWAFGPENYFQFLVAVLVSTLAGWLLSLISFHRKGSRPLFLFMISFGAASFFWPEPEVIVDAARYFTQAKHLKIYGIRFFVEEWGDAVFAWTDLPLVPLLYGYIFKLFGEHRIFVQILNTTLFSFTVVLTYLLGKSLWNEDTGFCGAVLLLGFPYLYTQVPLMLVDVPTMFFLMFATVTCYSFLEKGGALRMLAASSALVFLFYVKYSSWMMFGVIGLLFIYFLCTKPVQTIRRGSILAILSLLIIGVVFLVFRDTVLEQLNFLVEYQKPGLKRWSESYISTFLFQIHPFVTAAALIAIVVAIRNIDFRFLIISLLLLLFFILQVKRIRYTLPAFPMLALMAAYGLQIIQNSDVKKQIVLTAALASFSVAYIGYLPLVKGLGVQNLQAAGEYLNTISAERFEVVSIAGENAVVNPDLGVPILDIYTNKSLYYDKKPINPEITERIQTAPLRFTWEYPLPLYYQVPPKSSPIEGLVVITDDPGRPLPKAVENKISRYDAKKFFQQSSNIFKHQTFVAVYHK